MHMEEVMSTKDERVPGSCSLIISASVTLVKSTTSSNRGGSDEPSKARPPRLSLSGRTAVTLFSEALVVAGPAAVAFRPDS
jgi:hypothetical protein